MKLKKDAQIIERAEKTVFLVLGDKEICISDEPELEAVVNKLFLMSTWPTQSTPAVIWLTAACPRSGPMSPVPPWQKY